MKPTRLWLGSLAMAGSCLVWAGCGGGDVPDPASDSSAATETTAPINSGGPAAPAAPEPASAPAEPQAKPETATAAAVPAPAPEPEASKLAAAETTNPAPSGFTEPAPSAEAAPGSSDLAAAAPKADASGTEEMLRIGSAPSPPASSADSTTSAPSGSPNAASAPTPTLAGSAPGNNPALRGRGPETATNPTLAAASGGPGGFGGAAGPAGRGPGGAPGSFGARGTGNANDADPGPNAFRSPNTAVDAFLKALRAKNKDRLSQATARRAATEAEEKHRKIFAAILEQSISDEELDDMDKALERFQVNGVLPAKSTGQIGVTISRSDGPNQLQRTVMVRKEKEGWKVLDFGGVLEFKPFGVIRNSNGRRR